VAAPSQQGKPGAPQQTVVTQPQSRGGFFSSVKQFFKRPFERQPEVVPVQSGQPNRAVYRKRRPEAADNTRTASRPNRGDQRVADRNRTAERPARNERSREQQRIATPTESRNPSVERQTTERQPAAPERQTAERSSTVAPRSVPNPTPSGYLAPVSNPTEPPTASTQNTSAPGIAPSPSTAAASGTVTTEFNRERYLKAKAEAARDPQVKALALKLESAQPGEEYKEAARNYTKALFSKIREVDSSQNDWIERLEAATLRRIDEGKAIVVD